MSSLQSTSWLPSASDVHEASSNNITSSHEVNLQNESTSTYTNKKPWKERYVNFFFALMLMYLNFNTCDCQYIGVKTTCSSSQIWRT